MTETIKNIDQKVNGKKYRKNFDKINWNDHISEKQEREGLLIDKKGGRKRKRNVKEEAHNGISL